MAVMNTDSTESPATPEGASAPVVRGPGEGTPYHVAGEEILCRLASRDTAGAFSLFEITVPAGNGPPLHIHGTEEETFYVLEGTIRFTAGGVEHTLTPGACAFGPRGVAHRFENIGDAPARMLMIASPGGFEAFFAQVDRELPRGTPLDVDRFVRIIAAHGMTVV